MKKSLKLFFKSFVLSTLIFSIVSVIAICAAYSVAISVDPQNKESNILFAAVNERNEIISLAVVNVDPENRSISFVSVPDNTLVGESAVLQGLYKTDGIAHLEKKLENLLCISISRYLIFTPEKIKEITDDMGDFEYSISYPFLYENKELAGTVLINGSVASEMFSYENYDLKNVSLAEIGMSFFQSFLSKYANETDKERLVQAILKGDFCGTSFTNLSEKEITEYAEVFAKYPSMAHKNIAIDGEYNITSARIYFVPNKTQSNKNIFEK